MSLFQKPNPFAPSNTTSGTIFGSSLNAPSQPAQTGGLFGQPQAQTAGSIFGTSQPQQRSLFGSTAQPQQSTSIFGQPAQSQQQQSSGFSSSLFAPQPVQQTGSHFGGFGGGTTQQPQQQSLFGANQSQSQPQQQSQANLPPKLTSSLWQPGTGLNARKI